MATGPRGHRSRAVGEALAARGVDAMIGTSATAGVPNPPAFPQLTLDIADPASVLALVGALQAHSKFQQHGKAEVRPRCGPPTPRSTRPR